MKISNSVATLVVDGLGFDTSTKQHPFVALKHAEWISGQNQQYHTQDKIAIGERIHKYVETVFPYNRVYLNYRKKFIAIKVEGVSLDTAQKLHTQLLEDLCSLSNVEIAGRGTNIIFRIRPATQFNLPI